MEVIFKYCESCAKKINFYTPDLCTAIPDYNNPRFKMQIHSALKVKGLEAIIIDFISVIEEAENDYLVQGLGQSKSSVDVINDLRSALVKYKNRYKD